MSTPYHRYHFIPVIIVFLTMVIHSFGQGVTINPGVDTTDNDIKMVTALWSNYLQSLPNKDNINNSPFWAETEKKKYPKVDQLLNAINTEESTYTMGKPTILYVKPDNGFFEIKTLFSSTDSAENVYALCISSVFVKKENQQFKLYNALTVNSQNWKSRKRGTVTFHYPPTHLFNQEKADQLLLSINKLIKEWGLQPIPVDYYFADSYQVIQQLRGLDYVIGMGNKEKPSGMADLETNSVFAGGLGENYFHEVVHIYLNRLFPQSPLVEGLAVFYGGSLGQELTWHLKRLNDYLQKHPAIDLSDFDQFWYMDNLTNPQSAIQGLICYLAYQKGGLGKLKSLMSHDNIYLALEKEFGIRKDKLNEYIRQQINNHTY